MVALSGGVDSVAVCDFLSRKHDITCVFFHHNTENSERACEFVKEFTSDRDLMLMIGYLDKEKPKEHSFEEHWRNCRYNFFDGFGYDYGPIVTGHNLDDSVETYLHSSIHGKAKVIPYQRNNVIRPFLTTEKSKFVEWCNKHDISWCEDESNKDTKYTRNLIRHELMEVVYKINPGINKTVKKLIETKLKGENYE